MRYTLEEAAKELRKTRRWLNEWLRAHPVDEQGIPFYTPVGRDKILLPSDITRIEAALRGELCRSISGRRVRAERRTTKSGAATLELQSRGAAAPQNDPSLSSRSNASKNASSSTGNTRRQRLHLVQQGRTRS
jgi:hypothetical protein